MRLAGVTMCPAMLEARGRKRRTAASMNRRKARIDGTLRRIYIQRGHFRGLLRQAIAKGDYYVTAPEPAAPGIHHKQARPTDDEIREIGPLFPRPQEVDMEDDMEDEGSSVVQRSEITWSGGSRRG